MAIATGNTTTVSANGLGSWIQLGSGSNRVMVRSTAWAGTNAGLRFSDNGVDANAAKIRATPGGAEVVALENEAFIVTGPGYVTINVSAYGGTAITVIVDRVREVLGAK